MRDTQAHVRYLTRWIEAESVEDIDWSDESIWREVGDLFFQPTDYFRADSPEFQDFRGPSSSS